jgi:hypothetical protein
VLKSLTVKFRSSLRFFVRAVHVFFLSRLPAAKRRLQRLCHELVWDVLKSRDRLSLHESCGWLLHTKTEKTIMLPTDSLSYAGSIGFLLRQNPKSLTGDKVDSGIGLRSILALGCSWFMYWNRLWSRHIVNSGIGSHTLCFSLDSASEVRIKQSIISYC